ncbi:MAG: hypothetical protein Ct9H300mP1_06020 [Planctomycetaceae bacterium]|nr:MAG: hypothetical protein Ct9H300mP1_06020 [Planctomycetaceae bacterium]
MLTGRMGTRGGTRRAVIETPSFGSITSRLCGPRQAGMPAYVGIPWSFHHEYIGSPFGASAYLGSRHEPFESGHLPSSTTQKFTVPILELRDGLSTPRLQRRQGLLSLLDQFRGQDTPAPSIQQTRDFTSQGMDLLLSTRSVTPSTSPVKSRRSVIATDRTNGAREPCWPADWSKRVSPSR